MNIFKHIFVVSVLTVSCNSFGMFFKQELIKKPSQAQQQRNVYEFLAIRHLDGIEQQQLLHYINAGNFSHPDCQELVRCAKQNEFNETAKINPRILNITNKKNNTNSKFFNIRDNNKNNTFHFTMTSKNGMPTQVLSERNSQ